MDYNNILGLIKKASLVYQIQPSEGTKGVHIMEVGEFLEEEIPDMVVSSFNIDQKMVCIITSVLYTVDILLLEEKKESFSIFKLEFYNYDEVLIGCLSYNFIPNSLTTSITNQLSNKHNTICLSGKYCISFNGTILDTFDENTDNIIILLMTYIHHPIVEEQLKV